MAAIRAAPGAAPNEVGNPINRRTAPQPNKIAAGTDAQTQSRSVQGTGRSVSRPSLTIHPSPVGRTLQHLFEQSHPMRPIRKRRILDGSRRIRDSLIEPPEILFV